MQFPLREQIFSLKETKMLPLQGVDASFGVQVYIFWGASIQLLRFEYITSGVLVYSFLNVATRLSRRAEPSQHVC